MIDVCVTLDSSSFISVLSVSGHAGAGAAGSDIVCAAASVLARTAERVINSREYMSVQSSTPARGELCLSIEHKREGEPYLAAVQDFLLSGLASLEEEYPSCLKLTIRQV